MYVYICIYIHGIYACIYVYTHRDIGCSLANATVAVCVGKIQESSNVH